ncbi:MAG: hypothetical protein D6744_18990, partial [Planctomycetota bacterium]
DAGDDASKIVDLLRKDAPQPAAGGLPAGHPPIDGASPAPAAAPALPEGHPPIEGAAPSKLVELEFDLPEGWTERPPSNMMRRAQYELPGGDDGSPVELVVYYFGPGEGGSVQANLDRWKGQFTTADGKPLPAEAIREEAFESNGLKMRLLEVHGTFNSAMMPGVGGGAQTAEQRMIAGIVETPSGPWFIKAVGPDAAIAAQREQITAFLKSARVK